MKSNKKIGGGLLALAVGMLLASGCGQKPVVYEIKAEGSPAAAGTIEYLGYTMNVYQDLSSNSCGTCGEQPVSLYVGASARDVVLAIKEAVTRADDIWEVVSWEGDTIVLREKTAGSVENLEGLSAPEGLTLSGTLKEGKATVQASGKTTNASDVETYGGGEAQTGIFQRDHQRLAAVYGPSYEMLVVLGVEDRIVVRADVQTDDFPWALKVFPRIKEVPSLDNVHTSVNIEELMKYHPDMVYTFPRPNELQQLQLAKVDALPGNTWEHLEGVKEQLQEYAKTLGEEAVDRAREYGTYFDKKLAMVKEITDTVEEEERPGVYYAGMDILTTYGKYSDLKEVAEAAGGKLVSRELEAGNRTQIDYEQLIAWNPDYIFLDHGGINGETGVEELKEELHRDSRYRTLTAVKKDRIIPCPSGVFYWDMGLQKILLVMDMAKILHPEKFKDLDMVREVREFYQTFYGYSLTPEEAADILERRCQND